MAVVPGSVSYSFFLISDVSMLCYTHKYEVVNKCLKQEKFTAACKLNNFNLDEKNPAVR